MIEDLKILTETQLYSNSEFVQEYIKLCDESEDFALHTEIRPTNTDFNIDIIVYDYYFNISEFIFIERTPGYYFVVSDGGDRSRAYEMIITTKKINVAEIVTRCHVYMSKQNPKLNQILREAYDRGYSKCKGSA